MRSLHIDEDWYRDHFTRPVRAFYDSLFGRPVSDMEWAHLNKTFNDEYQARVHRAPLTAGAAEAIDVAMRIAEGESLAASV